MRFDTEIILRRENPGAYNASTGNYAEGTATEKKIYANVTNTKITTLQLVYGHIKQGSKTIRIQQAFDEPFDLIKIGGKKYRVDSVNAFRTKTAYVCSEVQ